MNMHRGITISFILMAIGINVSGQSIANPKSYPSEDIVSRYHNDWTQGHYKKRIAHFRDNPLEQGEIVFIGNSITEQGRDWAEKFAVANIRNRGIAGDVTDGVLKRLGEIVDAEPRAVFILIGVNDLFNLHHEEAGGRFKYDKIVPSTNYIARNIMKITRRIHRYSPRTKVFVRTILPTRRAYLHKDVIAVNNKIRQNESKGYYKVIDLYSQFVDENGELIQDFTVDGVHLNDQGYEQWVSFEKPFIDTLPE